MSVSFSIGTINPMNTMNSLDSLNTTNPINTTSNGKTFVRENSMLSIVEPGSSSKLPRTIIQIQKPKLYRDFTRSNLSFASEVMDKSLSARQSALQMISPLSKKLIYRNLNQNANIETRKIVSSPSEDKDGNNEDMVQAEKLTFDLNTAKRSSWFAFVKKQIDDLKNKPEFEYLIHLEAENRDIVETVLSDKIHKQNTTFYKFLWDRDGYGDKLGDRFITLILMYISSLIRLERMKLKKEFTESNSLKTINSSSSIDSMSSPTNFKYRSNQNYSNLKSSFKSNSYPSSISNSSSSQSSTTQNSYRSNYESTTQNSILDEEIQSQKKKSYNYLVQLSYTYSIILQRYRFDGDSSKEKRFYETLYGVSSRLVCSRFENQSLHPIIEAEIARLFRTQHFFVPQRSNMDLQYFTSENEPIHPKSTKQIIKNNTTFNGASTENYFNPLKSIIHKSKSKIAFSNELSPLMGNVFPVDTTKVNTFIDNVHMKIPPECLLSETTGRKKESQKSLVAELEEEISSGEMSMKDATIVQLQLKVLYELEATTRSAKHARELMEKSMV